MKRNAEFEVFPSPLEVNRFISQRQPVGDEVYNELPSPREVDSFISITLSQVML